MWHQNSRCYLLQGCLKAYSTTLDQFIYLFFGRAKGNCHRTLIFLLILLHWQKLNWELGSSMELICPNCEAVQKFENPNLLLLLHMAQTEPRIEFSFFLHHDVVPIQFHSKNKSIWQCDVKVKIQWNNF